MQKKIFNYEKKLIPITNEPKKSKKTKKVYNICKKRFSTDDNNKKVS